MLGYSWDTLTLIGIQMGVMGGGMGDRKNLKVGQATFEQLEDEKRPEETWDGFFQRLLDRPDHETMIREAVREELERFAQERENE